ncbi:RsmB/NOP family class I SAM-dependent RNA methyltransferase [Frankia sp. Cr1]|uniref:RsmB/NOP family class I SAM-dependent RNA methyltransferase n=1 Tax=Frankia sp. Cr1 TaxID=3073931 RepID=UPI002AD44746|nr:RsmB/NOP family class I SAM-dependent RNA methyltransferase [Frankia sp. Cr1]
MADDVGRRRIIQRIDHINRIQRIDCIDRIRQVDGFGSVSPVAGGARVGGGSRKRTLFVRRLSEILDMAESEVVARLSLDRRTGVRVNRLSPLGPAEVRRAIAALGLTLEPLGWCPDGYLLGGEKRVLSASEIFTGGHAYIQNISSLVPALALDPAPGEAIIDLCAAPGGKTAHIAALVDNDASLWANDGIRPRLDKLREVTQQFHVRLAAATCHPAQYADKFVEGRFDRVLLDAQCTGEGLVDLRDPATLRYWSEERVTNYGWLQRKMLVAACRLLRPGGILVYSTCTFGPEENEAPLSYLLRHHPVQVCPIEVDIDGWAPGAWRPGLRHWRSETFDPALAGARRILPGKDFEGFFVCKLQKLPSAG